MAVLEGHGYIAPIGATILGSLLTHGHRCALTMGYGYAAPLVLSLSQMVRYGVFLDPRLHTAFVG